MAHNPTSAVITTDASGRLDHVSRSAADLLNRTARDLIGTAVCDLLDMPLETLRDRTNDAWAAAPLVLSVPACGSTPAPRLELDVERFREGLMIILSRCTDTSAAARQGDVRRLEHVTRSAGVGTFEVDLPSGTSTVCTAWRALMGYGNEEVLDFQRDWLSRIHPDDLAAVLAADRACIEGGVERSVVDYRLRTLDGTAWRWMRSRASVIAHDAEGRPLTFMGIQLDITKEKTALLRLQDSERRFRAVVQMSPIGMALSRIDGSWIDVNPALCAYLGHSREELMRVGFKHVTLPGDRAATIESARALMQSGESSVALEKQYIHASGEILSGQLNLTVIRDEDGTPVMFLSQVVDTTQARRMEFMKNEFIATVNHELRTPVTSMLGALGLLENLIAAAPAGKQSQLIAIAQKNGARLKNLLNDILQVSALTAGAQANLHAPVSLAEVVACACETAQASAREFGVVLVPPSVDPTLSCLSDRGQLEQVLRILLSNATKFSEPGHSVRVAVIKGAQTHRIAISNNGTPIPESFRKIIFQTFAQSAATDTRKREGSGLGLSIAKKIVDLLGGKIDYSSDTDGTCFWLDLPAHVSNVVPMSLKADPAPPEEPLQQGQGSL